MPGKSNAPKRHAKVASRPAPAAPRTKGKAPKSETAFFVRAPELHVIISKQASGPHARSRQFASFDQARHAAIDALVDAIEDAEAQLAALKRAGGCDDLAGRRAV